MWQNVECRFCGHVSRVDPARTGPLIDCPKCRARLDVPDSPAERNADTEFDFAGRPTAERPSGDQRSGEVRPAPPSRQFLARTLRLLVGMTIVVSLIAFFIGRHARNRPRPGPGAGARAWPPRPHWRNRKQLPPLAGIQIPQAPANDWGDNAGAPNALVAWQLVPDPPAEPAVMPANHVVHISIPPGPNPEVLFPSTTSTMVSVGNVGHGREHREIWDLSTNRRVGTTRGLRTHSENLGGYYRPISSLSPDGRLFVTQGIGVFDLAVWDVVGERQLGVVTPEHAPSAGLMFAALANSQRLLACGFGTPFQMLDIAGGAGREMEHFPRDLAFDHRSLALSPGGRFLAVFDKTRFLLRFYDTESGTPAGQLASPFKSATATQCECIAFSPDGREVAALLLDRGDSFLACWDVRTGGVTSRINFGGNVRASLSSPFAYLYAPLEWFPDARRWLVCGQGIVDRHAGKFTSILPDEPNRWRFGLRHVIANDCVLSVAEEKAGFVLASLRPSPQNVERLQPSPAVGRTHKP
jgi:hypothetical protein